MNEEIIKQIKSELKFLNCQGIKYLVYEADFDCCHQDSRTINNRINKLKKQLATFNKPQTKKLTIKIIDLLNTNKPKPNIVEAIEILDDIKKAFGKHLDMNMSAHFKKLKTGLKP